MSESRVYAFAEPENDGERRVIHFLDEHLPAEYRIYHSMEREGQGQVFEYDVLVLAPHGLYALEVKDWFGRIRGNDREWLLDTGAVRNNPCPLIHKKAKVVKSLLSRDPMLGQVWVAALVVVADDRTQLQLKGNCVDMTVTLKNLLPRLMNPSDPNMKGVNLRAKFPPIHRALMQDFHAMSAERTVGQFRLLEEIGATDLYTEWRAENQFVPGATVRLKLYAPDPYLPAAKRDEQKRLAQRDFKAALEMGAHPHVQAARDFFPDDGRFVLVLDDLQGETLASALLGDEALTFERKVEIAADIAAALAHGHAHKVVHRDVRPGNIRLAAAGAVLTNFDCARVADGSTIGKEITDHLDPAYTAPEVRVSAGAATSAADIYALGAVLYELLTGEPPAMDRAIGAPSTFDPLVQPPLDDLVTAMLDTDPAARPTATDVEERLGRLREKRLAGGRTSVGEREPTKDGAPDFAVGQTIENRYLVRQDLGEGSFAHAYRIYAAIPDREYAMKVFHDPGLGLEDVRKEFNALLELQHQRIARVWHADQLRQGTYFLLTEYIDGVSLIKRMETQPPGPMEALRIARDVLGALGYVHARGRIHRDVKPSNVIVNAEGAWLIDFGIAELAASAGTTGEAGTPLYSPPDVATCGRKPSRDLYGVGMLLWEMLVGGHPYGGVPHAGATPSEPLDAQPLLTPPMAALLRKAVAPTAAERYVDADSFAAALAAVEEPLYPPPPDMSAEAKIEIPPEEWARPNYNPYLTRFLTLYSQNRVDNSGTRGYDAVSRATYVRTLLDKRLAPDILEGRYRLVIITGNAGDGKTAFLQRIEEDLPHREPPIVATPLPGGNGQAFSLGGHDYRTNYDGSQDEADRQNSEALVDFFAPFEGDFATVEAQSKDVARLIAINEGKLRDFLQQERERLPWLATAVEGYLDRGQALPDGYLLVNLNARSVVAKSVETPSIVDAQIRQLTSPAFWDRCAGCQYIDRCPVKFNVDTFNDPDIGPRVRRRLERLFEIAHVRGRIHMTMRSVRSALAFIIFGSDDCRAIGARLDATDDTNGGDERLLRRFYYNALAADRAPDDAEHGEDAETDRLLRLLREGDVGLGANAEDDRALHFQPLDELALLPTGTKRATYDRAVLASLRERLLAAPEEDIEVRAMGRRLQAALRRKAYFERPDAGWSAMLPFSDLDEVFAAMAGDATELATLRGKIIKGINRGEGLPDVEDALVLRLARGTPGRVQSYRAFPLRDFMLQPTGTGVRNGYLEQSPTAFELIHRLGGDGGATRPRLRIGLDLLQLLLRMAGGYAPSAAEWRGPLVNLLVFRTQLGHETYERVILDDRLRGGRMTIEQHNGEIRLIQGETNNAAD